MSPCRLILIAALLLAPGVAAAQAPQPAEAPPPAIEAAPPAAPTTSSESGSAGPEPDAQAAPAASEAPAAGTATLTPEELEALGFTTSEGSVAASGVDTDLHVFGFIDFSVSKLIAPKNSYVRGFLANRTNFYVGNFNLYLTKNLSKSFRTMGEVRFLYKPNGDIPLANGTGTPTTSTEDPADFDRALRWGGVEIERVYLEYTLHPLLIVRGGQFLTPYGIWNVDHGSPTFIPVQRPYVVGESLFPERQTGLEVFGRWDATSQGTLGYHLTLSNGEGPISEYRDLDENKAIGGRVFWEQHNAGLRVGGSAYYGRSTDGSTTVGITPTGGVRPVEKVYLQYDVLALAVDAVWRYRDLLVQAEWISRQRAFTKSGRVALENEFAQRTVLPADVFCWGVYGLIGYRLPWFGIMPYFVGQYLDNTSIGGVRSEVSNLQFGLNIRPIDEVVFKLEYSHAFFRRKLFGSDEPIRFVQAQAAWAF